MACTTLSARIHLFVVLNHWEFSERYNEFGSFNSGKGLFMGRWDTSTPGQRGRQSLKILGTTFGRIHPEELSDSLLDSGLFWKGMSENFREEIPQDKTWVSGHLKCLESMLEPLVKKTHHLTQLHGLYRIWDHPSIGDKGCQPADQGSPSAQRSQPNVHHDSDLQMERAFLFGVLD